MFNETENKMHQERCDKMREDLKKTETLGPWMDEPDIVEFEYPNLGYKALIMRTPFTFCLCAYVGIPKDHPAFGLHYDHADLEDIRVHGGLTFSDCRKGINEDKDPSVWWLGFDTAHYDDYAPGTDASMRTIRGNDQGCYIIPGSTYKDITYVRNELLSLAQQLKEMEDVPVKEDSKGALEDRVTVLEEHLNTQIRTTEGMRKILGELIQKVEKNFKIIGGK